MQKKKHRFWQHRFGRRHFGRRSCCCIDHHCYHHFYCGFFSNQTQQEAEPNWLGYENTAKHHLQRWLTNSYVSNRINSIDSNCNDPGLVFVFSVNQNAPKNKKKNKVEYLTNVQIFERVGGGNFGDVFKGKWNQTPVAMKRLKGQEEANEFKKECEVLSKVRHVHVVLFLGMWTYFIGFNFFFFCMRISCIPFFCFFLFLGCRPLFGQWEQRIHSHRILRWGLSLGFNSKENVFFGWAFDYGSRVCEGNGIFGR